jgi:hypothetical protein
MRKQSTLGVFGLSFFFLSLVTLIYIQWFVPHAHFPDFFSPEFYFSTTFFILGTYLLDDEPLENDRKLFWGIGFVIFGYSIFWLSTRIIISILTGFEDKFIDYFTTDIYIATLLAFGGAYLMKKYLSDNERKE